MLVGGAPCSYDRIAGFGGFVHGLSDGAIRKKADIFQVLKSENGRSDELCYADRFAAYIKLEVLMPNRYHYTVEKLTGAIDCLATHPGDVRERLTCAFLGFHTLTEKDFPPELQADWRWVMKELTKYGPLLNHKGEVWRGSVENTMRRVRKATGSKIAKKIYELYWAVSENQQYL